MSIIEFENGTRVEFEGTPTPEDVEEVAQSLQMETQAQVQPQRSGAMFPAASTDTPRIAALKAAGNTPQSALNFGKGVLSSLNPLNTLKSLGQIPGQFNALAQETGGFGNALGATARELPGAAYQSLVPQGIRQIIGGDIAGAGRTFTEDPFGQTAPAVLSLLGGAKALDRTAGTNISPVINQGVSRLGQTVTKPVGMAASGLNTVGKSLTRSSASQLTGMDPQTISQIVSDPKSFSRVAQENVSRGGLANEVGAAIDTLEGNLSQTGSGYNTIRQVNVPVKVPPSFIQGTLSKYGLKVDAKGKVIADTNSITRNKADIGALQNFYNNWGNKQTMTPNEFLNMRGDLAELSKFDAAKTGASGTIGKDLYGRANETIRPQIPGLAKVDEAYKPQVDQLNQLKRDYLKKDPATGEWVFKDGAVNKISNLTGAGKQQILQRLESLVPGVTKQIQILKAVEDIAKAKGIKVGTYTRGAIGAGAVLTGNVFPAIIGAIITNPTVAVPLIRASSITGSALLPIINALKTVGGDINHLKLPSRK